MLELEKKKFLSHVYILGFFTVISKIFGLIRDRLLAAHFGAHSAELDAYYAAFRIPDFIYNLIVLGTVSAAFVPVFLSYIGKRRTKEAYDIASSVMNVTTVIMAALAAVAFVFAEPLTKLIAPGFSDPETITLTVRLMRWMLVSPILFGIAAVLSGILNAYRRFIVYSLSSALYNVGIIVGIVFLVPHFGPQALAFGVVLGAFFNLVVQIPSVMMVGYKWRPRFDLTSPGFIKVMKLMFPRMLGFAALQMSLFVTTAIATTLQIGSTTVYNITLNLQYFPVTIVGVSIATAIFPVLALTASKQDVVGFRENFSMSFRKIIFFVVPMSILMLLFRAQIIRILFGTGNFTWEDTVITLQTLGFFTISLFAQALIPLLTRAFYSVQNTRIPVIVGVTSMIMNIILNFIFGPTMGVAGLALAFTIANIFNAAVLLIILRYQVGSLDDQHITVSSFKTIIASLAMGIAAYGMLYVGALFLNTHTYAGLIAQVGLAGIVGVGVFVALQYVMKSEELAVYSVFLRKKVKARS